jgi:hypothetical protein
MNDAVLIQSLTAAAELLVVNPSAQTCWWLIELSESVGTHHPGTRQLD